MKSQLLVSTFDYESSDTDFMSYKTHLNVVILGQCFILTKHYKLYIFMEQRKYIYSYMKKFIKKYLAFCVLAGTSDARKG